MRPALTFNMINPEMTPQELQDHYHRLLAESVSGERWPDVGGWVEVENIVDRSVNKRQGPSFYFHDGKSWMDA